MASTERGAVQSSPTVKYFMQPCLGTTNVIPVLIRGCLLLRVGKVRLGKWARFGTRTRTMNNEGIDDENEDEDDG